MCTLSFLTRIAIIILSTVDFINLKKSYFLLFIRVDESDDGDKDSEEEEEEESEEEGESSEEEAATSTTKAAQPELTRTEKRDLKKKQAEKQKQTEDEDPDLINPNHVQQKMNISDLNTPRELTRRERYARVVHNYLIFQTFSHLFIF